MRFDRGGKVTHGLAQPREEIERACELADRLDRPNIIDPTTLGTKTNRGLASVLVGVNESASRDRLRSRSTLPAKSASAFGARSGRST